MNSFLENMPSLMGLVFVIIVYILIRNFFKRIANFTEATGENSYKLDELKEEIQKLSNKIENLEKKINENS